MNPGYKAKGMTRETSSMRLCGGDSSDVNKVKLASGHAFSLYSMMYDSLRYQSDNTNK